MLEQVMSWISTHPYIFAMLFAMSEALGMLPGVKASGVFQAIQNVLKWLLGKFPGAK